MDTTCSDMLHLFVNSHKEMYRDNNYAAVDFHNCINTNYRILIQNILKQPTSGSVLLHSCCLCTSPYDCLQTSAACHYM